MLSTYWIQFFLKYRELNETITHKEFIKAKGYTLK